MSLWEQLGKFATNIGPLGSIASIGSTIGGIIGSIGQGNRQRKQAQFEHDLAMQAYEKQFADQQQMYQQQLADQRALIQEERAYNDFGSIMKRASKAGVNVMAALGQAGGAGMQASAGAVPSPSTPSASSGRISSPDNVGGNLISAGATLSAQSRELAMLADNQRLLKARADKEEVEAIWRERELRADVESKEVYIDYTNAQIGTEQERKRLVSAQADLEESLAKFQETRNWLDYQKCMAEIDVFVKTAQGLDIKNQYQADLLQAQIDNYLAQTSKANAEIYSIMQAVEQNWKELGLKEADLAEIKRHNRALEKQEKNELEYAKERDKKDRTQRYWQMGLTTLTSLADTAVSAIMPVGKILGKIPTGKLESVLTQKGVGDLTMAKNLQQFGGIAY